MQTVVILTLCVVSSQAFLFGGLGGLFGQPAGGCDPCAAARAAPYYPPQPAYQAPAYAPQPAYNQQAPTYQTAPVQHYQPQPAPTQYQTVVAEPQPAPLQQSSAEGYIQPPPPPPQPSSYATGAVATAPSYKLI